jgi:hypothetical protein
VSIKYSNALESLKDTYRKNSQIGLVLGAGVTKDSGGQLYSQLAYKTFKQAIFSKKLKSVSKNTKDYINDQFERYEKRSENQSDVFLSPDKILQFVYEHIDSKANLIKIIHNILYEKLYNAVKKQKKGNMNQHPFQDKKYPLVPENIYKDNKTLDALITFCAALPGTMLTPKSSVQKRARPYTNPKVGAILTTNYDNLFEAAFNSKYLVKLMIPVGREASKDPGKRKRKRVIPVYHMHGYISYVPMKGGTLKTSEELVISEEDYFWTFYNLLGFSNIVATSIFRQFSCLFVGCSMIDQNIRRILYQLQRERIKSTDLKKHFAILAPATGGKEDYEKSLLGNLNITPIRVENENNFGEEITNILKAVYTSLDDVDEKHWNDLK